MRRASGHAPCQVQRTHSAGRTGLSCTDSPDGLPSGRRIIVPLQRQALITRTGKNKLNNLINKNCETLVKWKIKKIIRNYKRNLVNRIQRWTMSVQLVRGLLFMQGPKISRFAWERYLIVGISDLCRRITRSCIVKILRCQHKPNIVLHHVLRHIHALR